MKRKAINTHYNTIRIQTFTVCTTPLPVKKLGAVQRLKPAKSNIYARPRAGLLFLPCCNTAPYKRLQRVLRRQCSYTAHAAKQRTGLCRRFSCYLPNSTATNTRLAQVAIIPPVQRWDVSQRPDGPSAYQIPPTSRTLYRPAQPPYYNKVYKRSSDHAIPVGQSSGMDAAGGAELLAAIAASLFGLSPDS